MVSSATSPAAAAMPARCTVAPPSRWRIVVARPTTASLPARSAPNGAERPLFSDRATESAGPASSASGTPSATAAFASRAPSTCTRQPCRVAAAASASVRPAERTVPPARVCVFSSTSSAARLSPISCSTACGSGRPPGASTGLGSSRAISAIAMPSDERTCDEVSSTTRSPGSQNVSRATRFAIPHVGAQIAAGLPRSAAPRSQRRLSETSSPNLGQPSSARRIASHIASVGTAQRSERRSITPGAGAAPASLPCARRRQPPRRR